VTFTAEGAKRAGVETGEVSRSGKRLVVPYEALLYDPEGNTHVYTSPKPLEYLRAPVEVIRIEGDRVLLSDGPPPGTKVVTVGATEVYGTELEVPSH
jgi:multidrug efflux pump subunit AcrA (membrane-fusion protein)